MEEKAITRIEVNLDTNLVYVERYKDPLTTLHILLEGVASQFHHALEYKGWTKDEGLKHMSSYLGEALGTFKGIRND